MGKSFFAFCTASILIVGAAFLFACGEQEAPSPVSSMPTVKTVARAPAQRAAPIWPSPVAPVLVPDSPSDPAEIPTMDPSDIATLIELGGISMDAEQYAEAIQAYEKVLEQVSVHNVRVDMGTCYRRMGDPEQAVAEYRKVLEEDPDHVQANMNLGVVLFNDLKDALSALEVWEHFLQLAPTHPSAGIIRSDVEKIRAARGVPATGPG